MRNKSKNKFLGVHVREEITTYLSLYRTHKNTNNTDIIRPLLNDWYLDCVKKKPVDWLVREIAESLQLEWNRMKSKFKNINFPINLFENWKNKIENQLNKRKIPPFYIDEILKKINK